MLPRISSALAKFISPIRPSTPGKKADGDSEGTFNRYEPLPRKNAAEPPKAEAPGEPTAMSGGPSGSAPAAPAGSPFLLQLFAFLKDSRDRMSQDRGRDSYRDAQKKQKKAARFRRKDWMKWSLSFWQ